MTSATPKRRVWVRVSEAAELLGVSQRTLRQMVVDGRLPEDRLASGAKRYRMTDLRKLIASRKKPRRRVGRVVEGITHGLYGYTKFGCRCDVCKLARRNYVRSYRESPESDLPPGDPRHGRRSTYVMRGCTCELCRQAVRDYAREKNAAAKREREWSGL